jgi:hypothetical protein
MPDDDKMLVECYTACTTEMCKRLESKQNQIARDSKNVSTKKKADMMVPKALHKPGMLIRRTTPDSWKIEGLDEKGSVVSTFYPEEIVRKTLKRNAETGRVLSQVYNAFISTISSGPNTALEVADDFNVPSFDEHGRVQEPKQRHDARFLAYRIFAFRLGAMLRDQRVELSILEHLSFLAAYTWIKYGFMKKALDVEMYNDLCKMTREGVVAHGRTYLYPAIERHFCESETPLESVKVLREAFEEGTLAMQFMADSAESMSSTIVDVWISKEKPICICEEPFSDYRTVAYSNMCLYVERVLNPISKALTSAVLVLRSKLAAPIASDGCSSSSAAAAAAASDKETRRNEKWLKKGLKRVEWINPVYKISYPGTSSSLYVVEPTDDSRATYKHRSNNLLTDMTESKTMAHVHALAGCHAPTTKPPPYMNMCPRVFHDAMMAVVSSPATSSVEIDHDMAVCEEMFVATAARAMALGLDGVPTSNVHVTDLSTLQETYRTLVETHPSAVSERGHRRPLTDLVWNSALQDSSTKGSISAAADLIVDFCIPEVTSPEAQRLHQIVIAASKSRTRAEDLKIIAHSKRYPSSAREDGAQVLKHIQRELLSRCSKNSPARHLSALATVQRLHSVISESGMTRACSSSSSGPETTYGVLIRAQVLNFLKEGVAVGVEKVFVGAATMTGVEHTMTIFESSERMSGVVDGKIHDLPAASVMASIIREILRKRGDEFLNEHPEIVDAIVKYVRATEEAKEEMHRHITVLMAAINRTLRTVNIHGANVIDTMVKASISISSNSCLDSAFPCVVFSWAMLSSDTNTLRQILHVKEPKYSKVDSVSSAALGSTPALAQTQGQPSSWLFQRDREISRDQGVTLIELFHVLTREDVSKAMKHLARLIQFTHFILYYSAKPSYGSDMYRVSTKLAKAMVGREKLKAVISVGKDLRRDKPPIHVAFSIDTKKAERGSYICRLILKLMLQLQGRLEPILSKTDLVEAAARLKQEPTLLMSHAQEVVMTAKVTEYVAERTDYLYQLADSVEADEDAESAFVVNASHVDPSEISLYRRGLDFMVREWSHIDVATYLFVHSSEVDPREKARITKSMNRHRFCRLLQSHKSFGSIYSRAWYAPPDTVVFSEVGNGSDAAAVERFLDRHSIDQYDTEHPYTLETLFVDAAPPDQKTLLMIERWIQRHNLMPHADLKLHLLHPNPVNGQVYPISTLAPPLHPDLKPVSLIE